MAVLLVASLALAACSEGPATAGPGGELGNATLALELPAGATITRVDYSVKFTFLESEPPFVYNLEEYSSVQLGGELVTILPCHTGPDGDGLNQVDVRAQIWVPGREEPYVTSSAGIFTCRRNADTLVNLTISVLAQLDVGFFDGDFIPIGTLCSAKVDIKDGAYLGTCATAKCDEGDEVLLFANSCQTVQAERPTYWLCGDWADWQINGNLANAFFPIPEHDGEWRFGVTALDAFRMAQVDPTLTDAEGYLTVWSGAGGQRAHLVKANGQIPVNETDPVIFEFAAELELAPQSVGLPAPHLLLLANQEGLGAHLYFQTKFGACDQQPLGVDLYPGLKLIDVRRDGAAAVRLILAEPTTGLASLVARCEATWDTSGSAPRPAVTCGAPTPLLTP